MYCAQCGTLIAGDASFCSKCGSAVTANQSETLSVAVPIAAELKRPLLVWLYIVGVLLMGTYAAMFIPAFAGQKVNPQTGTGSMLWTCLFFYLWWKQRARKGWQGALIGVTLGTFVFAAAAFIGGFMRAAAAG